MQDIIITLMSSSITHSNSESPKELEPKLYPGREPDTSGSSALQDEVSNDVDIGSVAGPVDEEYVLTLHSQVL